MTWWNSGTDGESPDGRSRGGARAVRASCGRVSPAVNPGAREGPGGTDSGNVEVAPAASIVNFTQDLSQTLHTKGAEHSASVEVAGLNGGDKVILRFELDSSMRHALKAGAKFGVGVDHENYRHAIGHVPDEVRAALIVDLDDPASVRR